MDRITGSDALGMMEAYNAVYSPQELTEEQVWEEVEVWVNSLVEEGYDLSEYTWEDMYDAYLSERAPLRDFRTRRNQVSNIPASTTRRPSPYNLQNLGASQYAAYKAAGGDAAMAQGRGTVGQLVAQGRQNINRFDGGPRQGDPVAADVAAMRRQIAATPKGQDPEFYRPPARPFPPQTRPVPPQTRPTPAPAGTSRPNAPTTPSYSGATGVRPVGTPLPTNAVTPVAGAPAQNAPVSAPTTAPTAPARTFNPLMQRTFGYQTGYAPSQVKGDIKKMAVMGSLRNSFDPFDIVMGYLIDEGYAENEEAAAVIMANMSEDWKQSIIESIV